MRDRCVRNVPGRVPAQAPARTSVPVRPEPSPPPLSPGVGAPGADISPNASPSGADGLLIPPVDQGGDATVTRISPKASGEMGSDVTMSDDEGGDDQSGHLRGDEGSPGGEGGDPVGEGGDYQPGSLREEGSPSAPGSPGAEARLKRILAAASKVVKNKAKKQAEIRWTNDATWTIFIECVKEVKPSRASRRCNGRLQALSCVTQMQHGHSSRASRR